MKGHLRLNLIGCGLVKKISMISLWVVVACGSLSAQTNVWQPSPGHKQLPIWPGAAPDPQPVPGPEAVLSKSPDPASPPWVVAGKPFVFVVNVSQPTMTVYSPKETNTGVAVIVFPGGGYKRWPLIWKARKFVIGSRPEESRRCS